MVGSMVAKLPGFVAALVGSVGDRFCAFVGSMDTLVGSMIALVGSTVALVGGMVA